MTAEPTRASHQHVAITGSPPFLDILITIVTAVLAFGRLNHMTF